MKKLLVFITIAFLGGLFINSCSDSSTTPTVTKELFPSNTGSYWIYQRAYVEEGTNKTATDSVVILGQENYLGQSAAKYTVYNENEVFETYLRYSQDSKLFALPSELLPVGLMALIPSEILPQNWVVIADDKASQWDIFSFDVTQVPLDFNGVSAVLNGQIKVTGTKGGTRSVLVNGANASAQEFVTTVAYVGTVNYMGANIPLEFSVITKSYFVDKIGLVLVETPEQNVAVTLLGQSIPLYKIDAYSRTLTKSMIVTN
jgi:hypothetical protein